ncbi:MAG TPA: CBS domain-containing protein [Nitrosopumilaceae archaeon]|jgi:CBS domain-containing protein|nr:CBS domain-containing protein [Nitrosopumilaceae archaeon]HLC24926.1 CBS domain-containing protein [Nitrosopumilaceae archaeon]
MDDSTFVKDIMKNNVISIDSSMTVKDASEMMDNAEVGGIVVMENNIATGIITERDIVRRIVAKNKGYSTKLKDVMSTPLITINSDETVWELAQLMKVKKIHRVPVTNQNKLVGIVTTTDLARICSVGSNAELHKITEQILMRMKQSDQK